MGERDIAEKTLEAYDDVFSDIINVLLFDGRQLVKEDELSDAAPLSGYKDSDGKMHDQERDVAKYWRNGSIRICLYGLENQTDIDVDIPLRVIGYDGAGYRSQILADKDKDGKKKKKPRYPVVTLVLYFGMDRWKKHRSLLECLEIPPELKPYVSDYKVNVFEIAWLKPETVAMFRSDFKIVADYFVQLRMNKEYKPSAETIRHVHEVLQLMAVLTKDSRFEEVQIPPRAEGGIVMCEVLDKVEKRGYESGQNTILTLNKRLIASGRIDDLSRASTDSEYLAQLLKEEGLQPRAFAGESASVVTP
ncbi:MAG: Rpn family recombination-promoting nuclease/putative transposase [Treponema sp.]|nr:Rpn family recombination-promoting nuclease/putative transposase [Treponema sp.]